MVIVSDASPLIALALCGKLDLLDKLFDQVCIPQAVYRELTVPNKPKVKEITEWAKDRIVSVKNAAAQTAADKNTAHFPGLCSFLRRSDSIVPLRSGLRIIAFFLSCL